MSIIKHIYRILLIKITNLFKGMHFFAVKRFFLNLSPGIRIGKNTKIVGPIWAGTVSNINIGCNTFINREFSIEGNGRITIGNSVDIGPNVRILTGGHLIGESRHRAGEGISYEVEIQDGCWIGACSTILGNSVIGQGCVVGAVTLVNKNCPANSLIVGHPGIVKRYL